MSETDRQTDPLDPARANALLTALERPAELRSGDLLPPFFHHLYFWNARPPSALGRDGHPRPGGIIPDTGLPRRMWAGGRLVFKAPLRVGETAEKRTTLVSTTRKTGRTGPLAFVTLRHEFTQGGCLRVTEEQDLVYREDPAPGTSAPRPPKARTDEVQSENHAFDSTLLFRYSALTFNGHRIHYDLDYARETEGYAGLIVHGPLLAQLLMLMEQDRTGSLATFSFRAFTPLLHHETATLCRGDDGAMWVRGPDGRQVMTAKVTP
ncbi:3-methylfumaryl-CoA hydratase [Salinihabitans flavidus]|uniref:3-methylfumaryl-CoA hydratase n=1 Tax=Salinihabitans flavidus TaxID=569882 RepID=A0A1H8SKP3_9RHOB|nr:MaoC family dehydratase N-terminal domain-containing protein [Salinihabitans flavidus]SEO79370.1 3-methylfumaryl-CoA hydratase [Salinihabitans flavidus]